MEEQAAMVLGPTGCSASWAVRKMDAIGTAGELGKCFLLFDSHLHGPLGWLIEQGIEYSTRK